MLSGQARRGVNATRALSLSRGRAQSRLTPPRLTALCVSERQIVTRSPGHWRIERFEHGARRSQHRALATAVDDFKIDNSIYGNFPAPQMTPYQPSIRPYNLTPFDPTSPLTIPEPPTTAPVQTKVSPHGIPGEADDMLLVFDACIRVGKLDRAALVLKRMNVYQTLSPEERILLHNQYLRASLVQLRSSPDRRRAEQLHKFYEMNIRNKGLPQTAETVACMLKASILSERGARLTRLITRYMGMAPGESGLRVLSMAEILSDQDLAVITAQCPTYNYSAEPDFGEDDGPSNDDASFSPAEAIEISSSSNADAVAELVPTPQRGESLTALKEGLKLVSNLDDFDVSNLSKDDLHSLQLQLERDSISAAVHKWRSQNKQLQKVGITTGLTGSNKEGSLSSYTSSWLSDMELRIKDEIAQVEISENKEVKSERDIERCIFGPFIRQADPARLAAVTILSTLNAGALLGVDKGIAIQRVINTVAKQAHEDIELQKKEKKTTRRRKVTYDASKAKPSELNSVSQITESPEAAKRIEESASQPWSTQIKAQVGAFLIKALIDSAKVKVVTQHPTSGELVSQYQPAFTHAQQPRKGKKVGMLILHNTLIEQLKREPLGDYLAKHLPMIVEPKPWKSMNEGGFLESKTSVIRVQPGNVEQRLYAKAAVECGDMKQVFKGLDVLGQTAWQINRDVLNVMMEAWNSGEETANMPALEPKFDIPAEPDSTVNPALHKKWIRDIKIIENERSGLHSQRCYMNLQLEIARAFRNQTIYFPHNVDYRGRAYPMPTYLNHMGADHARAVLSFAKGKPLGEAGLRWLKIHLANVYGLDKASFEEREAFANESASNIIESATNPLNGSRWWLKAEDPWQCLAACFELKTALELKDPTTYISHLPIQQDGTCNGLQHYAALGGDTWGAKQVNLEPGDRPADVYSAVADLVKQAIAKDAAANNKFGVVLNGKITRKVVKQTVMTNVYGVTFAGAKKQVCRQVDALYPDLGKQCGIPNLMLSTYIARHVFTALATMFRGAHDIQYWLGEIGGRVCRALTPAQLQHIADEYSTASADTKKGKAAKASKAGKPGFDELTKQFRSTLVWTTPLRMPVAQPYRKTTAKEIRTCLQSLAYHSSDSTDPVNRRKQLQGFPPNFIHSLDASHMLLSALECHDRGLDFAAVHDSFWTHAADVNVMNEVIRDSFIKIHEEDVIGRLAAEFETRHKGSLFLSNIDASSPVAKKIKALRKKSNLTPREELLLEHKRNSLRLSGNPWDLEAAKQIITPAAVYEEMAGAETDISIAEDISDIGLGEISADDAAADADENKRALAEESADSLDSESERSTALLSEIEGSAFKNAALRDRPAKAKTSTKKRQPVPVWLPLTIPSIPKKGDFDVGRLRGSQYFFS
ncbi:DNA-directed RNA polymerase, bacteriophage type [Cordyceps fumosorosea ARSEF 2679]|uniref:DNA-directed RNA polymerase n=1 Tax=Cordyceps fumosorosea (strain ARSEF 2679) TaxID=1081104 RepID=A0A167NZP5_CORFA|nr:DNA-directed RNA polymerase, bacteriophage type [Cordyceps fumosorosea ARSEF 2679]OAA56123.1 DNA-directed RNA polymerase, bacteriophage type [Cordyceps fumosorosea ARSEF 2679]